MGIVVIETDIEGVKMNNPDAVKAFEVDENGRIREVMRTAADL